MKFPTEHRYVHRILLLGGTSEIGLAILAAPGLPADTEVILAGRDEQRLAIAAKTLPYWVRTVPYDATEVGGHQAFVDGICADTDPAGAPDLVISTAGILYGAAKAGLDAFARGLADSLHGSGVRILLVRPGFVTGRMTAGMRPLPLATTPEAVGAATAAALRGRRATVWVSRRLTGLAIALRCVPRPLWRRISR